MYQTFQNFFSFCNKENQRKFYISIVLGVFSALFGVLKVYAIGVMLDALLNDAITNTVIWSSFGIMALSVLGASIINYRSTMLQTEAGYGTAADKRMEIAEHMRYLPMGYFNEHSLGRIISVTTNTMESLADVGTRVVLFVTSGMFLTGVVTLLMFRFDWRIGILLVLGLLIFFLVNMRMQKASRACSAEKVRSDSAVVEKVLEYAKGIAEVKSYHLCGKFNQKLETAIDENTNANIRMELTLIPYMLLQNFVAKMIGVSMVIASLFFYSTQTMTLFNCIMLMICSFLMMEGLEKAGTYSALLRMVDLCVTQAKDILSVPMMEIEGVEDAPTSFDLQAEHIDFSYGEKKIIHDLSVTIPQNTTTAIVGPSGGGKTTLCHLLSRFWDVDSGSVTLGSRNIKEYSMDALMRNFSFVFQNVYLFRDTIANNIRFGDPDAPMDKVIAAAKKARCHDFIMALPDGYDTVIGESGGTLSGGERQRLSIARAMMKDAPIIILDEATANVDPENEEELLAAIDELTRKKTIIMIAHRLKTVQNADQILVIDQGRIVQKGTHQELLKQDGLYSRFISQRELAVSWKL